MDSLTWGEYQLPTDYRLPQTFHRYKIWCAAFCDFILYAMFCECTVNLSSTLTKGLLLHLLVSCVAMCQVELRAYLQEGS